MLAGHGPPREVAVGASLTIDGRVTSLGRSLIEVNGTLRDVQDSELTILLRGILAPENEAQAMSSRIALRIRDDRAATTHVRDALPGLVSEGFEVLEGDHRGTSGRAQPSWSCASNGERRPSTATCRCERSPSSDRSA